MAEKRWIMDLALYSSPLNYQALSEQSLSTLIAPKPQTVSCALTTRSKTALAECNFIEASTIKVLQKNPKRIITVLKQLLAYSL